MGHTFLKIKHHFDTQFFNTTSRPEKRKQFGHFKTEVPATNRSSLGAPTQDQDTKMCDLLSLFWFVQICRRCLCLEMMPQNYDARFVDFVLVRFVAVALVSKRCPCSKTYDLLPLLWSRRGAPMPRNPICCRCIGVEVVLQCQEVRFCSGCLGFEVVLQC